MIGDNEDDNQQRKKKIICRPMFIVQQQKKIKIKLSFTNKKWLLLVGSSFDWEVCDVWWGVYLNTVQISFNANCLPNAAKKDNVQKIMLKTYQLLFCPFHHRPLNVVQWIVAADLGILVEGGQRRPHSLLCRCQKIPIKSTEEMTLSASIGITSISCDSFSPLFFSWYGFIPSWSIRWWLSSETHSRVCVCARALAYVNRFVSLFFFFWFATILFCFIFFY